MNTNPAPLIRADVAQRAVEWLVEMQSAPTDSVLRGAWQHWLMQDPEHARAWECIEAVNGQLIDLGAPLTHAISQAVLAPRDSPARRNAIKATALLIVGGGVLFVQQKPWRIMLAAIRTGVGQQRKLTLTDGSTLSLNTESAINVTFNPTDRHIQLLRGEIMVSLAANAGDRPFRVGTWHGEVRAVDARFTVKVMSHESCGAVYHGAIDIVPCAGVTRHLQTGKQASFDANTVKVLQAANDDDTAWKDGMVVARGRSLRDFLAELARYRHGYLSCDDAIAALRVSGTYPLSNTDRILAVLAHALSLEVVYLTRYWVTLRAART